MSSTIIGKFLEGTGFSPELAPLVIVMAIAFGLMLARYTPLLGVLGMPINSLLLFGGAWAAHQLIELAAPDYANGAKDVLVTSFSGMTCTALLILICLRPDRDLR